MENTFCSELQKKIKLKELTFFKTTIFSTFKA